MSNACNPAAIGRVSEMSTGLFLVGVAQTVFGFVISSSMSSTARSSSRRFEDDITATASLDFSESPSLTDESFAAELAGCTSTLISLSVAGCSDLTDESIKAIAECHLLTSLDVSGCGNLTDETLVTIAKGCELTSVNVSGCRELTDAAIEAIASSSLRSLNVAHCGKLLTDESIKAVAASCPSLTSLNVAVCPPTLTLRDHHPP